MATKISKRANLKNNLINLLKNYHPTEDEKFFKEQILNFINQYDNCFDRSLEVGHITASAWLLNNQKSKALLTYHTKLNRWLQLGGHCDGNPNVLQVAIKEAQEESGIQEIEIVRKEIFDIGVHLIPAYKHEKEHYHYDIRFLLKIDVPAAKILKNHESKELPTDNPSIIRMFKKWLAL